MSRLLGCLVIAVIINESTWCQNDPNSVDTSMVVEMVPVKGGLGIVWGPQTKARTISGI